MLSLQSRGQIRERSQHRQTLAPASRPMPGAEEKPDAERLGDLLAALDQRDDRLGQDQRQVVLEPLPQATALIRASVRTRADVYPDLGLADLDRISTDVVCPGIESAAAAQIESSVVPVAGENLTGNAATVQREAHMRAAIVERIDRVANQEQDNCLTVHTQDEAFGRLEVSHRGGPDHPAAGGWTDLGCGGHGAKPTCSSALEVKHNLRNLAATTDL